MEIGLFRDIRNNVSRQHGELFQFRKKRHTRGMKLFNISSTSKIDLGPPPVALTGILLCDKHQHQNNPLLGRIPIVHVQ